MKKTFVSNKDESVRMFKNNFLESLSKIHFSVPLIIFLPVVFYFLHKSYVIFNLSILYILALFIGGIIAWTLTEYLLHRFVFHFYPQSKLGKRIHFIFHGVHHDYPNDSRRLVMVPGASIPLAFLFYFTFYFCLGSIYTAPFFAGFVTGYLFYDTTHYALHHVNFKSKFWITLKNHHMIHHYKDSENGFGVSSKIWDHAFKTMYRKNDSPKQQI
jgi:sterol desaturase/sphingolipid hydroxylase (fatty acid hydroxylase superfamily)